MFGADEQPPPGRGVRQRLLGVERLLWVAGLLCLVWVGWALADARWFEWAEGRRLDRALAAHSAASRTDRLDTFRPGAAGVAGRPAPPAAPPAARPAEGTVLGRISVPRLGVSSLVLEGVSGPTLRRGVGHIPETVPPLHDGNVGLAGHRDTVFRSLQDIRKDDRIVVETAAGSATYSVDWTRIVEPDEVGVLAPAPRESELTLVTCYPFYYIGAAPQRFIVRAHRADAPAAGTPAAGASAHRG
jgi:sortase A